MILFIINQKVNILNKINYYIFINKKAYLIFILFFKRNIYI